LLWAASRQLVYEDVRVILMVGLSPHVGAPPQLLVAPLLGIVGPDLAPVLLGEAREGQQVSGRIRQQLGGGREPLGELVDDAGRLGQVEAASGWANTVRTSVATSPWADLGTLVSKFRMNWVRHCCI
jgi:hypothetical protein